jgi:hypothetical protein
MITHPYKYIYLHPTHMNTFKRLTWFDLEIHEVSHQKRLSVDGDVASH